VYSPKIAYQAIGEEGVIKRQSLLFHVKIYKDVGSYIAAMMRFEERITTAKTE
jgi:hypothetical protein